MKADRFYHSIRLIICRTPKKRAAYLKKHNILDHIGEDCSWGPWLLPLYPKMIRLHDNVHVHKSAKLVTHDMLNRFLEMSYPGTDLGHVEKIGCIELMSNVYLSMNTTVMPNVRINDNCIISAGSVVTSDIPENTIAAGVPAKPIGKVDMFMALRKMGEKQAAVFENQKLPDEIAKEEWRRFSERHSK